MAVGDPPPALVPKKILSVNPKLDVPGFTEYIEEPLLETASTTAAAPGAQDADNANELLNA